ncbi:MAG: Small heat shock protein HSP16.5 [Candidatus Methanolliviera sp. GoM_asphalt]|nr:MAG: Small heat shock protein HSP16.5 [Candidatus Methanolliviera sp. GoM_asphalt]
MAIRRWFDPHEEMRRMWDWMDKMLEEVPYVGRRLPETTGRDIGTVAPYVDVAEKEGNIVVRADIPGVKKEDISVNVKGDMLEIGAERKEDKEEKGEGYIRRERTYGRYYRAIPLSSEVDAEKVNATFEDGVLSIEVPKVEGKEVKKIEIK